MKLMPLFVSIMTLSSALMCNVPDELARYNSMQESIIAPSDLESAKFYLQTGDGYYATNHFDMALIAYSRACDILIKNGLDIKQEAKKLDREALIDFCDAFQGRLNCYIRQGNKPNKFFLSQYQLREEIDPRTPIFEEDGDYTIMSNVELDEENLEYFAKITGVTELTRVGDNAIMYKHAPCESCCESCENGDECEDDDEDMEFEQNIEKKSSN